MRHCACIFTIRTGCQNKVIKIQWPSLAIKPSVLHSNENDLQNRMFALPYTGPRYTYRKKGQSFFLLAVKKNILMHRHFWLCVKLSNPAPYFRLRYLLPFFLSSPRESVPFQQIFILHVRCTDKIIYSQLIITIAVSINFIEIQKIQLANLLWDESCYIKLINIF